MPHHQSIWITETYRNNYDIIIVGGGLLGLWTAYEFKKKYTGLSIAIFEAGHPPGGASLRNAGFACFGSPTELIADIQKNEEQAWALVQQRFNGIEKIKQVVGTAAINFEQCKGYECLQLNQHEIPVFEQQLLLLNQGLQTITGSAACFQLQNNLLQQWHIKGLNTLVENKFEGCLHSGLLHHHLKERVLKAGVKYHYGVEAIKYTCGTTIQLYTSNGRYSCKKLLFTNNAWLSKWFPQLHITPARGQIIVSPPVNNLTIKGSFHFNEGYVYFRHLPGNRVLIGGFRNLAFEEEATLEMAPNNYLQQQLHQFLITHFTNVNWPPLAQFTTWSGIMAMTPDKQPVLNKVDENIYAAMCCNGMGVALAPVFAEKVISFMYP